MDQQNSSKIKLVKFDLFAINSHLPNTIKNDIQYNSEAYLLPFIFSWKHQYKSIVHFEKCFVPTFHSDIETFYHSNSRLTLNLKAPNFSTNSSVKKTVKIMLRASRALSYVGGWPWNFMAKERVLSMMATNTVYSQMGDVAKAHSLYCKGFFWMYRRTGLAFNANSMQFLCKKNRLEKCK